MPYIPQRNRARIRECAESLADAVKMEGEANYAVTVLMHALTRKWGCSYTMMARLMGMLECVKQEYYRRVMQPYEDKKMLDNGDIELIDGFDIVKHIFQEVL